MAEICNCAPSRADEAMASEVVAAALLQPTLHVKTHSFQPCRLAEKQQGLLEEFQVMRQVV